MRFPTRRHPGMWLPALALAATLLPAAAQTPNESRAPAKADAKPAEPQRGLMLMASVSNPGVYSPVEGGKATVLAPAQITKYGVRPFSKDDWTTGREVWTDFLAEATREADRLVDALELQYQRDSRGVIDYALVEHPSPWLSSVLLSKRFLPRFEREFGKRLHVVVVDRHRFYVFPADGSKLDGYGASIVDIYHDESICRYPVSLEVFLVDGTGFRAIGSLAE